MRRLAGLFVFALLAAGLGGSAAESVAVAQTPSHATAVLALVEAYNGSRLAWLDPVTLRPLDRRSVHLPGGAWAAVHSPTGQYVALGGPGSVGIRIVDLRRMRLTARLGRSTSQRMLRPVAWPLPRRLLVLDSPQNAQGPHETLVVVDPVAGRVVARLSGRGPATVQTAWAQAGRRLVSLSKPLQSMAPVRVEIRGAAGDVLRGAEIDIVAGTVVENPDENEPRMRMASPGFAVDSTGNRAFVVSPEAVAEVDLDTLAAKLSRLAERRSLLSRLHSWLEPQAEAKLLTGWSRQATWLGENTLAVSGSAHEATGSMHAGLQLVDARTGATRMLEPRASAHHFAQGTLLAFGAGRDASTDDATGMGLSAFGRNGELLWTALGDEPVWWAQAAGGYAYVSTPEEQFPSGVRVIDLVGGAVVRTVRGEMPFFIERPRP
jgi:hypothetical protein